ncbi:plasma membrane-associated cation-binding protein 1 [Silene latifolia]|uniref:plasma membrane-associated cation-binding protein 1 n=1 Tax=Silene latifolia TaxID=37657 RepID=UPI003D776DF5
MGYWKTKVLPKIQKVFGKDNAAKKAEAVEACKSFDESKEEVSKEFEDKKEELQPKVLEIYEASSVEIKALVKDPKDSGLKKHSSKVQTFLDDLSKIEFPGSKPVCDASSKFGPVLVSGPITFIFEKVSTFIVVEEKTREVEAPLAATTEPETTAPTTEGTTDTADREVVVEEDKSKEETVVEAETTAPSKEDPPKVEEPAVEEPPKA